MQIYYNSRDLLCKKPFGAVKCDENIKFSVYCKLGVFVENVSLMIKLDGQEDYRSYPLGYVNVKDEFCEFTTNISINMPGLFWYSFVIYSEEGKCIVNNEGQDYQLTVYSKDYETPTYMQGGIIYHAFVDRFNRGKDDSIIFTKNGVLKNWDDKLTIVDSDGVYRANDFYGGNFQGIIDKLDYLKNLNVTILYLSPIFKSASNHRYDTGDYSMVDELLGSEEKFKELLDKAKKCGISIMLDGVFNHTGADSKYFNKFNTYDTIGAFQSKNSPYYSWYTFYNFPQEYHCWWGVTVCPTISDYAVGFREMIAGKEGIINKWTNLGVKGWRLDVVDELQEDFVMQIRKAVKSANKDALLIGEVWEDASNKISYDYRRHYFQGKELDGVMNYVYKVATLDFVQNANVGQFKEAVLRLIENYPLQSINACMNLIGTHDTVRAITSLSNVSTYGMSKLDRLNYKMDLDTYNYAKSRLKIASAIQYILPGIPSIYYGDEIGMQGFEDPLNRETMRWDNIDSDLLNHYIALGKIRKKYKKEMIADTIIEGREYLILKRVSNNKTVTLIANSSAIDRTYTLDKKTIDLLTNTKLEKGQNIIAQNSVVVFEE